MKNRSTLFMLFFALFLPLFSGGCVGYVYYPHRPPPVRYYYVPAPPPPRFTTIIITMITTTGDIITRLHRITIFTTTTTGTEDSVTQKCENKKPAFREAGFNFYKK
jgi:hypothetical protein